ncbi:Enoyl-(Acyl carrier protein) reductase-like protein 6 [Elsinoe fawcettii]|nr:Enoyl-(Acyl carrier protein) reductase-like protein 6 [Elsinoe fawcettii]
MDVPGFALITGAASGIGAASALSFAKEGAAGVALFDLNRKTLDLVADNIRSISSTTKVHVEVVDVSDEASVDAAVERVRDTFGRIDYVVNSAGIVYKHPKGAAFAETTHWKRVIDVNLNGLFYVLRATARIMLEQEPIKSSIDGRALQRGSIVNVASIMGVVGVAKSTGYTAAKHAVVGLTRTASEDHAAQGLRINVVCPGYIDTPFTNATEELQKLMQKKATEDVPMRRTGRPEEIADAVMFLSGGRSSFVTGSVLIVDGGYTSH